MKTLEQLAGAVVLLVALADVSLTILYARMDSGLVATRFARALEQLWVRSSRLFGRSRARFVSLGGPVILLAVLGLWIGLLTLGSALLLHPALGHAVRPSNVAPRTDFLTALYVGGASISVMSALDDRHFGAVKESSGVTLLWRSSLSLASSLARTAPRRNSGPKTPDVALWRRRYGAALSRFHAAGIATVADEEQGFARCAELRAQWEGLVHSLRAGRSQGRARSGGSRGGGHLASLGSHPRHECHRAHAHGRVAPIDARSEVQKSGA